jgi:cytochrome c553
MEELKMEDMTINTGVETTETATEEVAKTYTEEEMLAYAQSYADKRVTQARKTIEKDFQKQLSLSKLDGAERDIAERDNKIAELQGLLDEMNTERNKSELKSVLGSRGLSAEFADIIVINDDIEASQANIDKLDKLFKAAVKAEVEKRLAGSAPKGNTSNTTEMTKETAKKLSMAEMNALAKENPELFNKLFN